MDRKTLIILLAAVVIIICLVFGVGKENTENANLNNNVETNIELDYIQKTDEATGDLYYQIYNKETGEVIRNVVDESSIQMYIDNPDFVGPENEEIDRGSSIEYNEDGSVKSTSEIE